MLALPREVADAVTPAARDLLVASRYDAVVVGTRSLLAQVPLGSGTALARLVEALRKAGTDLEEPLRLVFEPEGAIVVLATGDRAAVAASAAPRRLTDDDVAGVLALVRAVDAAIARWERLADALGLSR